MKKEGTKEWIKKEKKNERKKTMNEGMKEKEKKERRNGKEETKIENFLFVFLSYCMC